MTMKQTLILIVIFLFHFYTVCGQTGLVETIYFKTNSFTIDKKYRKTLDSIAQRLSSDTFGYLKVFGYADTSGSDEYNDILSGKRAEAVYQYLLTHSSFDTTRVYVTWIGKSADAYDLHFPSAHIQRRCVDVWVTFYRKPEQ